MCRYYENLEKIKEQVQKITVEEMTKPVSLYEKRSFAAGFAVYNPEHDKTFGDVMKRADVEMYENKKMLKNL